MFGSIVSNPLGNLSSRQAVQLANLYLDNARNMEDPDISLVLCHDTEVSLSQAKRAVKKTEEQDQSTIGAIAIAYIDLGKFLECRGLTSEAQVSFKKGQKLGGDRQDPGHSTRSSRSSSFSKTYKGSDDLKVPYSTPYPPPYRDIVKVPPHIFAKRARPPTADFILPEPDERLNNTRQLAVSLGLLQAPRSTVDQLVPSAKKWLQATKNDTDEQERLYTMATEIIRAFKRDELKDANTVAEVVCLAPVLNKDTFRDVLKEFYSEIDRSGLLNVHYLEGLARLIHDSSSEYLDADDLVKILELFSQRLRDTHQQSTSHMHQLTLAVSHVLDAMADANVTGLDRETLHAPLHKYLEELKLSPDPFLVYQAAYAYQALLCVPDNETIWQSAVRRTGKVLQGLSGLMSAVRNFDLYRFMEALSDIQKGFENAYTVVTIAKNVSDVYALAESGHGLMDSLKQGFSFERKRDWYSALRGADALIQVGEFATLKELVYKVPCRLDPAFQWGICQRLGEIAFNPMWDLGTRGDAIALLGEMYRDDEVWGQQASVKQWIVSILVQLSSPHGANLQPAESLLQKLESNGDSIKQALYRASQEKILVSYPLKAVLSEFATPSLLDRVQNRPYVEGNIRLLRKQRTKKRNNVVYIPPQAKASLRAADDSRFPLMEKVTEFLESDQKVFLLLGDSGAGKSTFSRELEIELWSSYKTKTGRIPLHINLPAINKPEHDMIAKQLRKHEFTEPQIREMKHHRKFILICDGYDESQQTHNLYMSNQLNQPGEWDAKMFIICRSEYLGSDYRDRFQPGDRNQQSDSSQFQEAVITPFSIKQVHDYIQQYVVVHQPLWRSEDYQQALEHIPSLKDLMTNPFLMTLSLDVLPRMVDPGQSLSVAHITRVDLYDHFLEQWLERGKRRIGEKDLTPQSKAILERLTDEGFTQNGIDFIKKLAVAIYKEQGGNPVVEYSQFQDEGSWKDEFFLREDRQLLREACPLTRNGNQHQFIHRSLLEYGLARAIFDPHDRRKKAVFKQAMDRRRSADSVFSFEINDNIQEDPATVEQEPDHDSPLGWRTFVNDHSLLHFLEERVQQEPMFKDQLCTYIRLSKKDKKWRTAAANAITILVRAGVQFIGADLRGVQIPGADLSYGVFDSAILQGADLRKVNLRGSWLRRTDLSGAQMASAQFGELPFLSENSEVCSCIYSPDGKSFAVGLTNGNISIYTTSNWEKARTLRGHEKLVWRVVYSPKGGQIASASYDRTVRLWDPETGSLLHTLKGHDDVVYCVAYSPGEDQIASASDDGTVRTWNAKTGECLCILDHQGGVLCVTYSPNGTQIASSSVDSSISLWDPTTGHHIRTLSGHTGEVWDIRYSPQGSQVASASNDTTVRIWNVETGSCRHILSGHSGAVHSITYSPNGDHIASGSMDAIIQLWDVETGLCRQTFSGHSLSVLSVAFSPNGDQIASGGRDKTVRLWGVSAGASRLVSGGHSMEVNSVKCSPEGDLIASGSTDNTIRLWDVDTGVCRRTLIGHSDSVFSITYSPQGNLIASGSSDLTVRLWDVKTGNCFGVLEGHTECVHGVVYSYDGNQIASASDDKTIRMWDAESGECIMTLHGHMGGVRSVVYSPSMSQLASGSMDCTVRIWDIGSGECQRILVGHSDWVRNVAYSPHIEDNELASAGYDKTIRLWDLKTGECRLVLTGHKDKVISVVYSRDGYRLASGSWDKTVRLWDVASGNCLAQIQDLPGLIWSVAWGPPSDASYFVTACGNGSVLKWDAEIDEKDHHVRLLWNATNSTLAVTGASMQGVQGLSSLNKQLLKQRGAVGEPKLFQEESKKSSTPWNKSYPYLSEGPSGKVHGSGSVDELGSLPEESKKSSTSWKDSYPYLSEDPSENVHGSGSVDELGLLPEGCKKLSDSRLDSCPEPSEGAAENARESGPLDPQPLKEPEAVGEPDLSSRTGRRSTISSWLSWR